MDIDREIEDRAFMCPKCNCSNVFVRYLKHYDILAINCKRCEYRWEEKPSNLAALKAAEGEL
jgi:transcription elongation factor Elf1